MQGLDQITFRVRGHAIHVCPSASDAKAVDIWSPAVPHYLVRVFNGLFNAVSVSDHGIHIPSAFNQDIPPVIPGSNECVVKFSSFPGLLSQHVLRATNSDWAYVLSGSLTDKLRDAYNASQQVAIAALSYNTAQKTGSLKNLYTLPLEKPIKHCVCFVTMQTFPDQPESTVNRTVVETYLARTADNDSIRWSIETSMNSTMTTVERKVFPFAPYDRWNVVAGDTVRLSAIDQLDEIMYNRTYDFPIGLQRFQPMREDVNEAQSHDSA